MFKAVIFDIGGVVCRSPFVAIDAYEREVGLPKDYINVSITQRGDQGAWQQFERGELSLYAFYEAFGRDLSDWENGNKWYRAYCARKGIACPTNLPDKLHINGRELFGRMMKEAHHYDEHILRAVRALRALGKFRLIALTNNFARGDTNIPASELEYLGWQEGPTPPNLRALFDDFCDSSEIGMRKPEPRFYYFACARNNIEPTEAIFLDDIKGNLKPARELGMETIHVPIGGTLQAVLELECFLGVNLTRTDVLSKM